MSDPSNDAKSIFLAAIEEHSPEQWPAFLDQACAGDVRLRAEVEKLLRARSELGSFHEPPRPAPLTTVDAPSAGERPGTLIGPYKLLQQLGEGGMGTVYMAEQSQPVRRMVALKIIKPGMDSRHVIARFEAERQALALMDHPNIAKVLDAGTTESGRPYFVMELVKGVPITKYCDEHRLRPKERLELFVPVCQAVQHAHQKGIIHRDLKPSNVLVCLYDGKPVPKVIDFGIAKATGQKLTDRTMFTEIGQVVGTLEYMSPEQAEVNQLDIDTRSDIYSLGVLLYELLTGTTPLDRKRLKAAAMLEVLRLIREEEPPRPSMRLSESKDALPSISAQRQMEPAKLTKLVRGELDWIVMKALDKDRNRRYETANGLASDVRRYLADEPVHASPPRAGYRLKKFVKRNKGLVLAVGLVALALLMGMSGTTWGLIRAQTAREQAEKRLKQTEKGIEILTSIFHNLDPKSEEKEVSLRMLLGKRLEEAVKQLDGEAVGDPVAVARLQSRLGQSLMELAHYEQAEVVLTKALRTQETALAADHPDTLTTKQNLAWLYQEQGKYAPAETLTKEVLDGRTAKLGADHPDTLAAKTSHAGVCVHRGKYTEAEPLFKEALAVQTLKLGANHPDTLNTKHLLAWLYQMQENYAQAESLNRDVLEGRKAKLGADHADTLASKSNLAAIYVYQRKYALAERVYKEVLAVQTDKLGAEHPNTLTIKANLALSYKAQGNVTSAETMFKEVIAAQILKLGPEHPSTLNTKNNLAELYRSQGKFTPAEMLFKEALEGRIATLGADHPQTLATKHNLAWLYRDHREYTRAETLFKEVLAVRAAQLGPHHTDTLHTKNDLANLYQVQREYARAESLFEEVLAVLTAQEGASHPNTLTVKNNLAFLYFQQGKHAPAETLFKEVIEARTATLGADHAHTLETKSNLAELYKSQEKYASAEALYKEVLEVGRKLFGADDPRTAGLMAQLGHNLLVQKKHAEAEPVLRDCLAVRDKKQPDAWGTFNTRSMLGAALLGQKKYADAEPLLLKGYEGIKEREKTIPAVGSARIPEALDRLIELYTATNRPDEAKKWQAERARYADAAPKAGAQK